MCRVMAPGDFRIFDPSIGLNLDRHGAQPGPGMGLNLDQARGSLGTCSGPIWDPFGPHLGPIRGHLGPVGGPFGVPQSLGLGSAAGSAAAAAG